MGLRNRLIWLGQQKTRPGMLSSSRGGAAIWVSLFSSRADMHAHMDLFLLSQPSECSHALEQPLAFAFPSCIPAPHSFLLHSSLLERSNGCGRPWRVLSARRKALGQGNAMGMGSASYRRLTGTGSKRGVLLLAI